MGCCLVEEIWLNRAMVGWLTRMWRPAKDLKMLFPIHDPTER